MILRILTILTSINILLFACGGGWDYSLKQFNFLEQRETPFSNYSDNLNYSRIYNDIHRKYQNTSKEINIQFWQKKLDSNLTKKEVEEIVYNLKYLELVNNQNIKTYLQFIKKQEINVTNDYYTNEELENIISDSLLIQEALENISKVNESWLKVRYFYIALRLAHYSNNKALKIYEKYNYLLKNSDDILAKDWIHAIYAGALIKNKNIVKGVYEFSKLLDKERINWHLSFYNFHQIKSNEQWKELITLTKNNDEKIKLYTLRALHKNSNVIEELKNIYAIDKNSKWFDFLLFRQLSHSQHFFNQYEIIDRKFQTQAFIDYLNTIKKDDMYIVNLSLSYFNLYKNNIKISKNISKNLLERYPNNHEIKTLDYILTLHSLKNIDLETENKIHKNMTNLILEHKHESNYINDYTFVILEKLYKKQNNLFKAFLSKNINNLEQRNFNLKIMNQFKEFMSNKTESKMEEYLKKIYYDNKYIVKENNKYYLSENLKKTNLKLLINNQKFEEALTVDSLYLNEKLHYNPFNVYIKGNNKEGKIEIYTLKEFLKKIVFIKKELDKKPKNPMNNYLYANVLYNLSYFGNSNIITTSYRSSNYFSQKELELEKINKSIHFYKKAIKYSKIKEFKAKITYLLAKNELSLFDIKSSQKAQYVSTEQVSYYSFDRAWRYSKDKIYKKYVNNGYGEFFNNLEKKYSNTKYYKELINECANLRFYKKIKR